MPGTKLPLDQGFSATGGLAPITNRSEQLFLFFGVVHMQKDGPEEHCMCGFHCVSLAARDEAHAKEQILSDPKLKMLVAAGWKQPEIFIHRASHSAMSLSVLRLWGQRIEEARKEGFADGVAVGKANGFREGFREAVKKVGSNYRGITMVEID